MAGGRLRILCPCWLRPPRDDPTRFLLHQHRGAVWNFSPDGPARAHARSVAMPRSTPGKPVGSVGPFPLPISST